MNIFIYQDQSYWKEVAPALGQHSTEIPSTSGAIQEDDGPCWTIWRSAVSHASHVCLPVSSEGLKVNFRTLLPCYLYLYYYYFFFVFECGLSHSQWVPLADSCSSVERTPQGIVIFRHLNWVYPELLIIVEILTSSYYCISRSGFCLSSNLYLTVLWVIVVRVLSIHCFRNHMLSEL